MSGVPFLKN